VQVAHCQNQRLGKPRCVTRMLRCALAMLRCAAHRCFMIIWHAAGRVCLANGGTAMAPLCAILPRLDAGALHNMEHGCNHTTVVCHPPRPGTRIGHTSCALREKKWSCALGKGNGVVREPANAADVGAVLLMLMPARAVQVGRMRERLGRSSLRQGRGTPSLTVHLSCLSSSRLVA
jgi:hypothetical protein